MAELRPLSTGEILDASFKLYTSNWRDLFKISAVVLIPLGIISAAFLGRMDLAGLMDLAVDPDPDPTEALALMGRFLGRTLIVAAVSFLGTLLVQGASIRIFAARYDGRETSWRESLSEGAGRLPGLLGTALMNGLGVAVGVLLCIAPGVWLWASWYVAVPALMIEGKSPAAALGRSYRLVKQRFWPTLGVAALAFLIVYVIQQVVGATLGVALGIQAVVNEDPAGIFGGTLLAASSALSTLVSIFVVPFTAAVATVVYFDLRVRLEGYDLEMLFKDLGDTPIVNDHPPPDEDPFGLGEH